MSTDKNSFSERESLALITEMIGKAKDSYHDTGIAAIMWGSVIAFCSLIKVSELHFNYKLPFDIFLLTFVAVIPQILLSYKERKKQTVRTYNQVALDYTWTAFGIAVFLMVFVTNAVFAKLGSFNEAYVSSTGKQDFFRFSEFTAALFLIIYGIPTFITGAVMKFKPMLLGGIVCWAASLVSLFTPVKIDLLLTALSAGVAWLIPGIILFKKHLQRKAAAQPNV
ncbi:MAG: hypothetical protein SFU21_03140 [Flavihumibacter sp.]|nr:hypothetical protein [Flavihumibacter sp.]